MSSRILFDSRTTIGRLAAGAKRADVEVLVLCDHDREDFEYLFGNGVVVNTDE